MKTYEIRKKVSAKNLKDALKKEKTVAVDYIIMTEDDDDDEDQDVPEFNIGFQCGKRRK